ncbi:hypothetical protein [Fimbriiglobus ruber]|uniref:Uncharacterized protein n=1 Tax=Fimbriiglobus ruber TaxID=1908690 RepID=A0A225DG94_9BACT|nr:hypothetical protein [Fimbriiglobus ruber]OWK40581.1 hypothetical protein FRUB_05500 [Fimbriiglobus ruber]
MNRITEGFVAKLDPVQARDLAQLVELEARWESLRKGPSWDDLRAAVTDLRGKQKAYDVFQTKLLAYNQRHKPAYVSEPLLSTPGRLLPWCRTMRDLFALVEHDTQVACPVHMVEKAVRLVVRLGTRMGREFVRPAEPPATIRATIEILEDLIQWCDRAATDEAAGWRPEAATASDGTGNQLLPAA